MVYGIEDLLNFGDIIDSVNKTNGYTKKNTFSVSKIVHEACVPPFDERAVAERTMRRNFNDPNSEYYQMNVDAILDLWHSKRDSGRYKGMALDKFVQNLWESGINDEAHIRVWANNTSIISNRLYENSGANDLIKKLKDQPTEHKKLRCRCVQAADTIIRFFEQFYNNGYKPSIVCYEKTLFLPNAVNGRFDALFYIQDMMNRGDDYSKFILVDVKNDENILKPNPFDDIILGPYAGMEASSMNLYSLQLNMYKHMLTNTYGLKEHMVTPYIFNSNGRQAKFYKCPIEYDKDKMNELISLAVKHFGRSKR